MGDKTKPSPLSGAFIFLGRQALSHGHRKCYKALKDAKQSRWRGGCSKRMVGEGLTALDKVRSKPGGKLEKHFRQTEEQTG